MRQAPFPQPGGSDPVLDPAAEILDPVLAPLGFAPAQGGVGVGGGQVIFCRGFVDSADDGCVDLVIDFEDGWGRARLSGATTEPGAQYTDSGERWEAKGLKHRAAGSTREVPLPPPLVDHLRRHVKPLDDPAGHLFLNAPGRPMTASNYSEVWHRARAAVWADDEHGRPDAGLCRGGAGPIQRADRRRARSSGGSDMIDGLRTEA